MICNAFSFDHAVKQIIFHLGCFISKEESLMDVYRYLE